MGDTGEDYRAWDDLKKKRKDERLNSADDSGWNKHTAYHWSRMVKYSNTTKRLDYWPSTGACRINGKRHSINSKFIQSKLIEENN